MSSWWRERDPDLPRDRETKSLGRRDWNWFATFEDGGQAPADLATGQSPWRGHPTVPHDRFDRTLGIPPRHICMWPDRQAKPGRGRPGHGAQDTMAALLDDLAEQPAPDPPPDIPAALLGTALTELAPAVAGHSTNDQQQAVATTARAHGLDPDQLDRAARGVAQMIVQSTHRAAPAGPGVRVLGALMEADLPAAARLYLARAQLAWAAIHSDPDLPRLWILANGLSHAISAHTMLTEPARSDGPIARLIPEHRDLVGWHGMRAAVEHMATTVRATNEGHRWLRTVRDTSDNRLLGLGVLHLTHPQSAHALALRGPGGVDMAALRGHVAEMRGGRDAAELSDAALKALCDRNGWLLGTADERTGRELVERRLPAASDNLRTDLAAGRTAAVATALAELAPSDTEIDRATWRRQAPSIDTAQTQQLLNVASREAVHRFTGLDIHPHPSRAVAYAARFPDRLSARTLRAQPGELGVAAHPGNGGIRPAGPMEPNSRPAQLDL